METWRWKEIVCCDATFILAKVPRPGARSSVSLHSTDYALKLAPALGDSVKFSCLLFLRRGALQFSNSPTRSLCLTFLSLSYTSLLLYIYSTPTHSQQTQLYISKQWLPKQPPLKYVTRLLHLCFALLTDNHFLL